MNNAPPTVDVSVEDLPRRPFFPPRTRKVLRSVLPWSVYRVVRRLFWRLLPVFVAGSGRLCPLCGSEFRRFAPGNIDTQVFREHDVIGGGFRKESVCLGCGSNERVRHLYLFLRDYTSLFEEPHVLLHLGPDEVLGGRIQERDTVDYYSGDLFPSSHQMALGLDARCDVCQLPFSNESFDVVLCNHVLEHVPNDIAAMEEVYRVLRPGGWAVLQVPISPSLSRTYEDPGITGAEERKSAFGLPGHVRLYGRDYDFRLRGAGFDVEHFQLAAAQGKAAARRYGLISRERLHVARKPA